MIGKHVHMHVHIEPDERVLAALDRLETRIAGLTTGVQEMALDFTNVENKLAQNSDAVDAASSLMSTLADEIRALAGNPAALQALADSLDSNTQRLAAAVVANTPQAPAPPAPPEPTPEPPA